jgi:DNA-damage-inducible protein D
MEKDLELQHHQTFEEIKQIDQDGNEFWYARELAKLLGYSDFRNFQNVIAKAKEACINSGFNPDDHLVEITEVVKVGSGAGAPYPSFTLSRYACYLVVQNADPSKPVVEVGKHILLYKQEDKSYKMMKHLHSLEKMKKGCFYEMNLKNIINS